jgi:hypothetical protein
MIRGLFSCMKSFKPRERLPIYTWRPNSSFRETAMPKSIYDRGLLKPDDIARLQRVFDEACRRREAHPESAEARELALTLLALHNAGMVDEEMLMEAVGFRRLEPKSA